MAGRRRGARSGRGWDAAPSRAGDATPARRRKRGGPALIDQLGEFAWPEGAEPADSTADPAGGAELPGGAEPADSGGSAARGAGSSGRGAGSRWAGRGRFDRAGSSGRRGDSSPPQDEPRDEAEVAREICLRQLAVRPRTRAELAKALSSRGISQETAAEVLDRYDEVGMIDDAAFARAWVASRHQGRGLARRALATELRRKGVDSETAGEALGELDDSTEAATARALVDRKLRTTRGEPAQVFRRLVGMLARKGYPPGIAIRAVKEALAAQSAEAAEFAEQVDADALAEAEAALEADAAFGIQPPQPTD
jgi:regulatory protein